MRSKRKGKRISKKRAKGHKVKKRQLLHTQQRRPQPERQGPDWPNWSLQLMLWVVQLIALVAFVTQVTFWGSLLIIKKVLRIKEITVPYGIHRTCREHITNTLDTFLAIWSEDENVSEE